MHPIYPSNLFNNIKKSPFFYSNFVATIDGKVQADGEWAKLYWPIGSKLDFDTLLWLRAHADVLIHGKKTAIGFRTLQTLSKTEFREKREKLDKKSDLIYMVLSNNPTNKLIQSLDNPPHGVQSCLVTTSRGLNVINPRGLAALNLGEKEIDLKRLVKYFQKNNLQKILIEGGPTLMGSFLAENMIDELFITIVPKIFGSNNSTKTMVEGYLFPPNKIPLFKLISAINKEGELYLRYQKR